MVSKKVVLGLGLAVSVGVAMSRAGSDSGYDYEVLDEPIEVSVGYECREDGCERVFEKEHGRAVHEGKSH
jgi:hypothetical protein